MSNTDIKETCKQIIEEANAIIAYTDSIEITTGQSLRSVFTETMTDELSHLQKLIVALTEIFDGDEPTSAEEME